MTDHLVLLTSVNHKPLSKTFSSPNLVEQPFAVGKDFKVTEEPVSDLQSLAKILQRLGNDPTQTIIRGSMAPG